MKNKIRALRRFKTQLKAKKKLKSLKQNPHMDYNFKSLGYFYKHHPMDCGNSKCCICGNPRKNKKVKEDLTIQEQKAYEKYLSFFD
tara:strand:- start:67 stop:324 length:258 start_codon:yes stop_codon:yes gene_type:complete